MERYNELVQRIAKSFSDSGLDFAFTGALAVSFYGAPRTTSDIDIMIAIGTSTGIKQKVIQTLKHANVEADEHKIENALTSGYPIASLKDKKSPYRVDLIFSQEKLDKQTGEAAGVTTYLQKPEGLIAAKLRMIKATIPRERATKDTQDVKTILAFSNVNLESIKQQAKKDKTTYILESLI